MENWASFVVSSMVQDSKEADGLELEGMVGSLNVHSDRCSVFFWHSGADKIAPQTQIMLHLGLTGGIQKQHLWPQQALRREPSCFRLSLPSARLQLNLGRRQEILNRLLESAYTVPSGCS
jgi:hypothetical protein